VGLNESAALLGYGTVAWVNYVDVAKAPGFVEAHLAVIL